MTPSVRIASYNILANAYLRPAWYRHVDPVALLPEPRRHALLRKMENLDVDILCLQEVEEDAYAWFEAKMKVQGYRGIYAQKGQNRPDGCATFVRQTAFQGIDWEAVYYRDGANGASDSGHLALIVQVESGLGKVRVANTHIRWATEQTPTEEHIGYREMRELIEEHIRKDAACAWIVCGDFNAVADSPVVTPLVEAGLTDAYALRPQFTCNPNGKAKRIDYLFHTAGLQAEPMPLPEIGDRTPLPSLEEPSDHLAIAATFRKINHPLR